MKALITGVTGQDGYYLSKLLLDKVMRFMDLLGDRQHLTPVESTV